MAWRELRELSIPALAVVVVMACLGADRGGALYQPLGAMLAYVGLVGGGFGLFHGLLDRRRRDDGFLLHRPSSALAIHAARTLVGLGVVLGGALAAWGAHTVHVLVAEAETRRWQARLGDLAILDVRVDPWPLSTALLVGALAGGAWAVARYAVSRRDVRIATFAAVALPVGLWSILARSETVAVAVGGATAITLALATLQVLDLAGARR
jgi:hypothetical protein